jgi:hypothetical protein
VHFRAQPSRIVIALLLPLLLLAAACSSSKSSASTSSTPIAPPPAALAPSSGGTAGASPVAAKLHGSVAIDFAGAPQPHDAVSKTFEVEPGTNALDAIKAALGADNLSTKDFGGNLGVFIAGLYGIDAEGNHFWEFTVNGKSSDVGVSSYEVKDGDVLGFRYSSF